MMELQWRKSGVYKKLKQGKDTKEKLRNIAQACRDDVRKDAAQLELKPVSDVKGNNLIYVIIVLGMIYCYTRHSADRRIV